MQGNLFFGGDNLSGLHLISEMGIRVDLVYIDPPFATNNEFLIDDHRANAVSAWGIFAYADTNIGNSYLHALWQRLCAIRQVMASRASIYVHIDVKMEHHVRRLMDIVFGPQNFRNSITRIKCNPKNFARNSYGNIKDTILFYSLSPSQITWHPQTEPFSDSEIDTLYPFVDEQGRRYTTTPLHAPGTTINGPTGGLWRGMPPPVGRHWRYAPETLEALDESGMIAWSSNGNPRKILFADDSPGKLPQDVWLFKDPQRPMYPTQKNSAMLKRIILTSSEPGDTVLDCYAGSGITLVQAALNGRRFIGMDDSSAAQEIIAKQLSSNRIPWERLNHAGETMLEHQLPEPLDFAANEHQQNLDNLNEVANEIAQRTERLRTRILHFSDQFGIPEDDFWGALEADPAGPLAAVLAREARRQNIHERAAAHIRVLPFVEQFRNLPASGPNASYINANGQVVTGAQLAGADRPSKSLDFQWQTGAITCYAAQKYTREGGGNQDNQFNEVESLLQNFLPRRNNGIALFVLVDGPYYTDARLRQLRGLVRLQEPRSYVASVNELVPILQEIAIEHPA
jgi:adenine-specific DNA-methyltransferase